jgi:glycerate kinase
LFKVLVAPTAFKGTFSPLSVAEALAGGLKRWAKPPAVLQLPLADGGDGTIAAIYSTCGGVLHAVPVSGPLGDKVSANWLELNDLAVVELASACGIAYLQESNLNALGSHTFGLGEVIKDCLDQGKKEIVVTLGGSASSDGGVGALTALGAVFASGNGGQLKLGAEFLCQLKSVDLSPLAEFKKQAKFKIAGDVVNPLIGPTGAAHVFARQKGASEEDVVTIEQALTHLADIMEESTQLPLRHLPGTGAAGGTAFGLAQALSAEIISGFAWFSQLVDLPTHIRQADLIISGEGSLDFQSLPGSGKVVGNLISLCESNFRPLALLAASVDRSINWNELGVTLAIELGGGDKLVSEEDIAKSAEDLEQVLNLSTMDS